MEVVSNIEKAKERAMLCSDMSDMLVDMSYAEKLVLDKDFLESLANIGHSDTEYLSLSVKDAAKYRYEGDLITGISTIVRKVNQVFAAMEIPFRARQHKVKNEDKYEMRIYRVGKTFKAGMQGMAEPTVGMRLRADKWLTENSEGLIDTLQKIGIEVNIDELKYLSLTELETEPEPTESTMKDYYKKTEIPVHGASGFTKTVCGLSFATTVPCRMTNVIAEVTCPDCITILEIWKKNETKES